MLKSPKLVIFDPERNTHMLMHGTTAHGLQSLDAARVAEQLVYYHRTGPIGDVFAVLAGREAIRAGMIGLGAGCLAAYARPGDRFTFYELDPDVVRIAREPAFFTFLSGCRGKTEVVIGDGLAMLEGAPDGWYDLIVMDAFDSDSIPEHLYSGEAVALYRRKLAGHGLLMFNTMSTHVDLGAIISATVAGMGLTALKRADINVSEAERAAGKLPSIYLTVTGHPAYIHALSRRHHWEVVSGGAGAAGGPGSV